MKMYQIFLDTGETFAVMAADYTAAFLILTPKQRKALLGIKEIQK